MTQAFLHIHSDMYQNALEHLLEQSDDREAAGFMFVNSETQDDDSVFKAVEWFPVPEEGFLEVTDHHFALSDWVRADVIKRAHDLDASIAEFHSHLGPWPAEFSLTDQIGFQDFVPHVMWRLKGRPYLAVVVTPRDIDALVWMSDPKSPQHLDGIRAGDTIVRTTQLSHLRFEDKRL